MSSVTINGHTYSDDSNASTGLAAGGHRTRFIPLISDVVVVAAEVESDRANAETQAGVATTQANTATTQAGIATTQAGIATTQAGIATAQAGIATAQAGIATTQAGDAAANAAAALQYANEAHAISETGLPSQTGNDGKALTTNGTTTQWTVLSIPSLAYANRGTLRTNETNPYAVVDGLGLFQYVAGSDEPDDDESCFATTNGRWLLQAVHWDVVDAWQLPDDEVRDAFDEDEPLRFASSFASGFASSFASSFASRVLFGTATSSITSLATVTQTSFTGTITGAAIGDSVIATPPNALGARISVFARVTAANTVTVYLNNPSETTQTLVAGTWKITVLKEIA